MLMLSHKTFKYIKVCDRMTKRRDIVSALEAAGFRCVGGARHDKFVHPDGRRTIVERHRDIPDGIAREIMRQARIKDGWGRQ